MTSRSLVLGGAFVATVLLLAAPACGGKPAIGTEAVPAKEGPSEREYSLGSELDLTLETGQAIRLLCHPNPYKLKEIRLEHKPGGLLPGFKSYLMTYLVFENGRVKRHGPGDKSYRVLGPPPQFAEFVVWSVEDHEMSIWYRTETDREVWQRDIDEFRPLVAKGWKDRMLSQIVRLEWDSGQEYPAFSIVMHAPGDPYISALLAAYPLEEVVAEADDNCEKVKLLLSWVHDRWQHHGTNRPSRQDPITILREAEQGESFRCVEYAIVMAACAQAVGLPARVVGLKTEDVETRPEGAGHVAVEVWLDQLGKWAFADPQLNVMPVLQGTPLNAVEFQDALARRDPDLSIESVPAKTSIEIDDYEGFIARYLYYFDFSLRQRFDPITDRMDRPQPEFTRVMLVPKGAKNPTVFQGEQAIKDTLYVSDPRVFYPSLAD